MSAQASLSDLKPAPAFPIASSKLSRSRVERASRSSSRHDQHVALVEPLEQLGKLRSVAAGSADLLRIDFRATGSS